MSRVIKPGRAIRGMSAILLLHLDADTVDWPALEAHIARRPSGVDSLRLEFGEEEFETGIVAGTDADAVALPSQGKRDRSADAFGGAGDERRT